MVFYKGFTNGFINGFIGEIYEILGKLRHEHKQNIDFDEFYKGIITYNDIMGAIWQKGGEFMSVPLRKIDIEELLGRKPLVQNNPQVKAFIRGRTVLVTGGGGSVGGELCRQIAALKPAKLVLLDVYDGGAYKVWQDLKRRYGKKLDLSVEILSVCDKPQLERVFRKYRPEIVCHAAAHKHIPLMEGAVEEAVKNNVLGTLNTALLADKYKVKRFVLLSADNAVNPTSVVGATRRCCELLMQAMNRRSKTEYTAVRLGNVWSSDGSVVSLFAAQIAAGGPVTVTHPDMTRYFMTAYEAAQLVLAAVCLAQGDEIFIQEMGQPLRIVSLANKMIELMGLKPGKDIRVVFTGLRPGEKLHEELLMQGEQTRQVGREGILAAEPAEMDELGAAAFWHELEQLRAAVQWGNVGVAENSLQALVPTYQKQIYASGESASLIMSAAFWRAKFRKLMALRFRPKKNVIRKITPREILENNIVGGSTANTQIVNQGIPGNDGMDGNIVNS
jgi:FlaA1/EpsC-like NDP-sugar epimerase